MNQILIAHATEAEVRTGLPLGRRLREFNYLHIGRYPESEPIWLNATSAQGETIGGLRGIVVLHWLRIELLWIEESFRHQGAGARLVSIAEARARELGAYMAGVETFEWQAPDFYRKLGYLEATRIDDYIDGRALYFMIKSLQS